MLAPPPTDLLAFLPANLRDNVDALAKIAEQANATTIAAVCARLEDSDCLVRWAAGGALAKIAEQGNTTATAAV